MTLYKYKVKNKKSEITEDVMQANDQKEAAALLKAEGLQVISIKNFENKFASFGQGGVTVSEKAALCRFLATMLRAGLPLPEAIDIIREESKGKKLKQILIDAAFHIRKGQNLFTVFSKYKTDFDSVFLTMIKAGEESGTLEKTFDYLAKQLLASYELTQKVKSSMMYPAVILAAMVANGFIMLGFVLPKMSDVFLSIDVKIPTATRFLLNFGKTVGQNLVMTIALFFIVIVIVVMLFVIRQTRTAIMGFITRLPVIRKVMEQLDTARFARTLSTLLKSGVPIMVALDVSSDVVRQPYLRIHAKEFSKGVAKGESLSDILTSRKNSFPITMTQSIKAGEKTGSLEVVLEELASFYEMEVDYGLKRATALLEPLMMLVIGLVVGVMVVLLITPIYSIVGGLENGGG